MQFYEHNTCIYIYTFNYMSWNALFSDLPTKHSEYFEKAESMFVVYVLCNQITTIDLWSWTVQSKRHTGL